MSDLFAGLRTGVRMPELKMNDGPLPNITSLPAPYNGSISAKINYNSTLLGDIQPYEIGQPKRIEDQINYVNVPDKVQKIIPPLRLPDARGTGTVTLAHGVANGDVAFSVRMKRNASTIEHMHTFDRLELSSVVDPFVNLATTNYLMAGVQRYWNRNEQLRWQQFMVDTDFMPSLTRARSEFTVQHALRFVRDVVRPFGVVHGSENQGGLHEGGTGPYTFPTDYVTSLAVCGQVQNLVNLWRDLDVSAGDDLIFRLVYAPICLPDNSMEYVLNHWRKGTVRQRFDYEPGGVNSAWQLMPEVYSLNTVDRPLREQYDWRVHGYWHVARAQVLKAKENTSKLGKAQPCYHDDLRMMRGALLDVTFEPLFASICEMPRPALNAPAHPYRPVVGRGAGLAGLGGAGGGGGV